MRIKFLSAIVSFLLMSVAVCSCLDSDDETYEYSSDASIHAFGIDTIHGKYYKFTIDQLNRLIYNRDSLPVGSDTIIDKILIDTLTVTGWVTCGAPLDTLFNMSDSVDLTPAMNNDTGMKFKVHAADGITTREYTLKVNVHLQDPDLLTWTKMEKGAEVLAALQNEGEQKAVILNEELFLFGSATTAYVTSTNPGNYGWSEVALTGLPDDVQPSTTVAYGGRLYVVTESKRVYGSADGTTWAEVTTLGDHVVLLIGSFTDRLSGIVEIDGKRYFHITKDGKEWERVTRDADGVPMLEEVPADFPTRNISSTRTETGNGVEKIVIVGMPQADETQTVPWFSLDGRGWADMGDANYDTYCPYMENPVVMYYDTQFYCFGGEMDTMYSSVTGIAWSAVEEKFLLPAEFAGKGSYTVVVEPTKEKNAAASEKRDFIWVIFGGSGRPGEVWRGRLNKLGFEIQ